MTEPRPAIRVDHDVIFTDGCARTLTHGERFLLWLGVKRTVARKDAERTLISTSRPEWYLDQWRERLAARRG